MHLIMNLAVILLMETVIVVTVVLRVEAYVDEETFMKSFLFILSSSVIKVFVMISEESTLTDLFISNSFRGLQRSSSSIN